MQNFPVLYKQTLCICSAQFCEISPLAGTLKAVTSMPALCWGSLLKREKKGFRRRRRGIRSAVQVSLCSSSTYFTPSTLLNRGAAGLNSWGQQSWSTRSWAKRSPYCPHATPQWAQQSSNWPRL